MRSAEVVRALVAIALWIGGNAQAAEPKYGKVDTFEPGKKYTCVPTADHKSWNCTEIAAGKPAEKAGGSTPTAETAPLAPPAAARTPEPIPAAPAPAPAQQSRPKGSTLPSYLRATGSPGAAPSASPAESPAPAAVPAPEQVTPAAPAPMPAAASQVAGPPPATPSPRVETAPPAPKISETPPPPSRPLAAPTAAPSPVVPVTQTAAPPAAAPEATRPEPVAPEKPAARTKPTESGATTTETAAPAPAPAKQEPAAAAPAPETPAKPAATPAHTQPTPSGARGNREFLALPASDYVIELAHSTNPAELAALHASLQLTHGELYELHLRRDNGDWWLLVWASFDSVDAARAARNELPSDAAINAGWPRRIGVLQGEARRVSSNQD